MPRPTASLARRAPLLCALLLLWPLETRAGTNTWTSIGPEGGDVLAIVVDPSNSSIAYAATYGGGIFKTTDGGATWSASGRLLYDGTRPTWWVTALAIDPSEPSTLYAASFSTIFRSVDGGATWEVLSSALADYGWVWMLRVDPGTPKRVYAGTNYPSLWRSDDGGATWTALHQNFYRGVFLTLDIDPGDRDTLYAGGLYQYTIKSTDGGMTWTNIPILSVFSLALDPAASQTIYFGSYGSGMQKSTDGGATWAEINDGLTERYVLSVAADSSGNVYAATDGGGVFRSTDGGAHWTASSSGLPNGFLETLALDPGDSATLYVGGHGTGVFKSANFGSSWTACNSGLDAATIQEVATHPLAPSTLFAALRGGGIAETSDGGSSWTLGSPGPGFPHFNALSFDPSDSDKVYAATYGGLLKSMDGGTSWNAKTPPSYFDFLSVAVSPSSPETVYASAFDTSSSSAFKSTDGGENWTAINQGLEDTYAGVRTVTALAPDPTDSSILFGLADGRVFKRSEDTGTWMPAQGAAFSTALAVDPVNPKNVYAAYFGVSKSTDGGVSWSLQPGSESVVEVSSLTVDSADSDIVYATSSSGGVFKSIDAARSWDSIAGGLLGKVVTSFAIDPSNHTHVFAGIYAGGVVEMRQVLPEMTQLSPASGPPSGGAVVTITGAKFAAGASVRFGATPGTNVVVFDENTVQATAPVLPTGFEDVIVANADGQAAILRGAWFSDFVDVPQSHVLHDAIVRIARAGITTGCGTGGFCPDALVTRAHMAIFLLRAEHGSPHHPPPATGTVFGDVPKGAFASAWIEEFAAEGITRGCGGGNFCPTRTLTRGEMSVFVLRTVHGPSFFPPDPVGLFLDVSITHPFARWIEQLEAEGITTGCGSGRFCPEDQVTRAHLAGFLARAFHLP